MMEEEEEEEEEEEDERGLFHVHQFQRAADSGTIIWFQVDVIKGLGPQQFFDELICLGSAESPAGSRWR